MPIRAFETQLPDNGFIAWSKKSGDPIPEIKVGESIELTKKGVKPGERVKLSESFVKTYLPFLSARITNRSNSDITIRLGAQNQTSFDIPKKKAVSISGHPFVEMQIFNVGTENIAEDEIRITCENDMEQLLLYAQSLSVGLKVAKHTIMRVV